MEWNGPIGYQGATGISGLTGFTGSNQPEYHPKVYIPSLKEQMINKIYLGTENNWQKKGGCEKLRR